MTFTAYAMVSVGSDGEVDFTIDMDGELRPDNGRTLMPLGIRGTGPTRGDALSDVLGELRGAAWCFSREISEAITRFIDSSPELVRYTYANVVAIVEEQLTEFAVMTDDDLQRIGDRTIVPTGIRGRGASYHDASLDAVAQLRNRAEFFGTGRVREAVDACLRQFGPAPHHSLWCASHVSDPGEWAGPFDTKSEALDFYADETGAVRQCRRLVPSDSPRGSYLGDSLAEVALDLEDLLDRMDDRLRVDPVDSRWGDWDEPLVSIRGDRDRARSHLYRLFNAWADSFLVVNLFECQEASAIGPDRTKYLPTGEDMVTGEPAFYQFSSHSDWVNKAASRVRTGDVCVDSSGRICRRGSDFADAVYPVFVCCEIK